MKIVVCGDSFASACTGSPGLHFSELLMDRHEVINLARGGISNVAIAFQLEQAFKLNPDVLIYTNTGGRRIEVPNNGKRFNKKLGLKNFAYPYMSDASSKSEYVGDITAPVLSDVIECFINEPRGDQNWRISDEMKIAVKYYITYLYDDALKDTVDNWAIEHWITQHKSKEVLILNLKVVGAAAYEFFKNNRELALTIATYHTDSETQVLIANNIRKEIELCEKK